ncbi:MFS transporter [Natronorarus salvus]|uniref:MFS transporter n=1 Tax=Natronorarus salvus TaxID=3117733 RepID=UPI002F26ACD2
MAGWKRYTGLILLWQVAASVCFYAVYAVTPFVREGFDVSATLVGVMLTALMLGYTLCLLPVGSVIDAYGEKRALVVGLLGLAVAVAVVTLAGSYTLLLVSVLVLGAFYATAMPGTNAAVFNAIPHERLNTSMGIKQVGVTAGSGIAALAVPWFGATRFGWEVAFLLAAAVAGVVSVVFWVSYDAGGEGSGGETDRGGIRAHLTSPAYVLLTAAGFFLGAGLFTTTGYTILYVHESVGASVVFAGVVLAAAQVSGSAGRVVFGWLADRLSASLTAATLRILLVQSAASAVLFVAVILVDSPTLALLAFTALGLFVLGFTGVYYSCMGSLVPSEEMGSATAGGQIALNAGALCAPPAFGLLVDRSGYAAGWAMLAVAAAVAFCLLAMLARRG